MAGDVTGSAMRVGDIGHVAHRDLQLRIPHESVVRLDLRARPEETGWIIGGTRKSQVLDRAFAREHMGALLQAYDGTRTLDEIGEVTDVGSQAVLEAVSLLWTGGIVEEGDTEPTLDDPPPKLTRLLFRLGGSTGVNDSWQDAAHRLAAAQVAVAGGAEPAGKTIVALEPTLPETRLGNTPRRGDILTVLVEAADSAVHSQEVARRCRQEGVTLPQVRAEQEAVTVGPYVGESFPPCLACAYADEFEIGPRPEAVHCDIIADLATRAMATLPTRTITTYLPGDVWRIGLAIFTYSDRLVVSCPGCPACSMARAGEESVSVASLTPVGARYKQSVVVPPAVFVDLRGYQQHYRPSNLHLRCEFRDWPVYPRTPLPSADLECLDQSWSIAYPFTDDGTKPDVLVRPTPSKFATILALSVGMHEPLGAEPTGPESAEVPQALLSVKLRRWTAAGGNIGSVTVYVFVPEYAQSSQEATVAAGQWLISGTYAYIERDHVLALINPVPSAANTGIGAETDAATEARSDLPPDGVGARIILTGNVGKVVRKYFSFALHIAIQDCGCFLKMFHLVARALGVLPRAQARWDEQRIARALGTDPARRPACIVVDLGSRRAH